jgi:hypothetical protein
LRLNIINSNGNNVILTLDNNPNTCLGDLSEYIGSMFNIKPKDILYKDTTKTEVLSPSIKIAELMILYPRLYKTLHIFNMKDYRQSSNDNENNIELNENLESKENDLNLNNTNNINNKGTTLPANNTLNDSELMKSNNLMNEPKGNRNIKMNFDYKMERNDMNVNKKNLANNKRLIYNDDYEIRNKEEKRYKNEIPKEDIDENYTKGNWENKAKYKMRVNYYDKENNEENEEYIRQGMGDRDRGYASYRNKKVQNLNDRNYQENYNKQYKNYDKKGYYDNSGD